MTDDERLIKMLSKKKEDNNDDNFCSINDNEIGKIFIKNNGEILGDKVKIEGFKYNYKIPFLFKGFRNFEIEYFDEVKEEFNEDKDDYINCLKKLLASNELVVSKIIEYVLQFFNEDNREKCRSISASAYAHIQSDMIYIDVSFVFENPSFDEEGYIDLEYDCSTNEIKKIEEGYY